MLTRAKKASTITQDRSSDRSSEKESSCSVTSSNKIKSVSINDNPTVVEIPLTPNNRCRKDYRKQPVSTPPTPKCPATENPLLVCPCGFPCSPKLKAKTQDWVYCDICEQWFHRECLNISKKVFNNTVEPNPFSCITCSFLNKLDSLDPTISKHFSKKWNPACSSSVTSLDSSNTVEPSATGSCNSEELSAQGELVSESPPHAALSPIPINFDTGSPEPSTPTSLFPDTPIIHSTSDIATEDKQVSYSENHEHIVIIDGIDNPAKFKNSKVILKQVATFKPKVNCLYAYALPRGGIALHCNSSSDKEEALKPWPTGAFDSDSVQPHSPVGSSKRLSSLVIRNIPTSISDTDIQLALESITQTSCVIHRFKHRSTNTHMPIVSAKFTRPITEEKYNSLVTSGLSVKNINLNCEPYRQIKVIRCYACQGYGHISKACNNSKKCRFCAIENPSPDHICAVAQCVNCETTGHTSFSSQCPRYISVLSGLSSRKYISNHAHPAAQHTSPIYLQRHSGKGSRQ